MALRFVTIGSMVNVHVYEDGDFDYGIETDGVAYVGSAPTNPNEVLRLTDIPTLDTIVAAAANITDHAIVRGDGGARGIQDTGVLIDDSDNLTLPDGAVFTAHNSDHSHLFSRAVVGYVGSGNEAGLQHRALDLDGTNYAIQQLNLGTTYVNCVTGKELHFCRNDVSLVTLTQLTSLVDNSMVDTLHRHSELSASDGTPDGAVQLTAAGVTNVGDGGVTNYTSIAVNGYLTLFGTARAWKSRDLDPTSVRSPGANAPANDTIDDFDFHRYDRGTEESVFFHWGVPDDYGEGTANVRGQFKFLVKNPPVTPAGDEVVVMGFEYKIISEGDVFDFTGGTSTGTLTETIVEDETASIHHLTAYGTLDTTGLVHGDTILFRFFRDATNVADTYDNEGAPADNDVWVWDYHLEYITDKLGHAI